MPKAKTPKQKIRRGGLDSGKETPAEARKRRRTEQEQREITLSHLIDSVCSGQWRDEIVTGRLEDYPPNGMKLSEAKVLTPPHKAVAEQQSNSGGKTGTRRWTPRGKYGGCRWRSLGQVVDTPAPEAEDEHDLLEVGETRYATRWWPPAICYSKYKYKKAQDEGDSPPRGEKPTEYRVHRHDYATDETSNRVLRLTRIAEWDVTRYVIVSRNRVPMGGMEPWTQELPEQPVIEQWKPTPSGV